jgi:signal transduction histidine kinase
MLRIASWIGGGAFISYAILSGLVVPTAAWFPASIINQETFFEIFHVPVQLFRVICAVLIAISVGLLLRIFRLETMQRLRTNEDRLHLAIIVGNIGIWDWDVVKNKLIWDESMYALYAIHKDDFGGSYEAWSSTLHPDDRQFVEGEIQAALNGVREYSTGFRILHPDGSIRQIKAASKTFYDQHGTPLRMIGTNVDITDLKQTEAELQSLNETLEQQVSEQTQLNIKQERLLIEQSRNAVMGEMMRNIAHQWRQPLNGVGLVVQNIREDFRENILTEEGLNKDVDTAMQCLNNMSKTINDFRDFYRPDKAKKLFTLYRSIDESLSLIDATLKNSEIEVSLSGDLELQIFGYVNELSQVILNLLANAKDALVDNQIPNGRIEIELHQTEHAVMVVIRDNAGGVLEEAMEKIFEPYFTTKISGSGIGLYMSKIIIEKYMGGSITFRNTADGAEFTVSIPST